LSTGKVLRSPTLFEDVERMQLNTNLLWKYTLRKCHRLAAGTETEEE